jgi:hypothetical protein
MAKIMFGAGAGEIHRREVQASNPKQWTPRGFFRTRSRPMSRREVALKASNARLWLEAILNAGPRPAVEILRLAKLEGFSECGVRRAKKRLGVKTVKTGGRQHGYGAKWMWQSVSV